LFAVVQESRVRDLESDLTTKNEQIDIAVGEGGVKHLRGTNADDFLPLPDI
jgi:hypothetical protein